MNDSLHPRLQDSCLLSLHRNARLTVSSFKGPGRRQFIAHSLFYAFLQLRRISGEGGGMVLFWDPKSSYLCSSHCWARVSPFYSIVVLLFLSCLRSLVLCYSSHCLHRDSPQKRWTEERREFFFFFEAFIFIWEE